MTKFAERKKKWGEEMVFKSLSLPENIIEKLKILRELYRDSYGRPVSYGEIFERLFSSMGLGNVDPGVYIQFKKSLTLRADLDDVVMTSTDKLPAKGAYISRCREILKMWGDSIHPSSPDWTGEWFVHPDGRIYGVMKEPDTGMIYADVSDELVDCQYPPFATEEEMLAAGFLIINYDD